MDAEPRDERALPAPMRELALPLNYTNSYIFNGGVIVPQFGDPLDGVAVEIYEALFPDRRVYPVMTREFSLSGGNVHCMTMQQPA